MQTKPRKLTLKQQKNIQKEQKTRLSGLNANVQRQKVLMQKVH